jgi:large subunit ribosomal protein L20
MPKDTLAEERMYGPLPKMPLKKGGSMHTETERTRKEISVALWITRINAGARQHGMSYSQFMGAVTRYKELNLIVRFLADLAMNHPEAFAAIVKKVKK